MCVCGVKVPSTCVLKVSSVCDGGICVCVTLPCMCVVCGCHVLFAPSAYL